MPTLAEKLAAEFKKRDAALPDYYADMTGRDIPVENQAEEVNRREHQQLPQPSLTSNQKHYKDLARLIGRQAVIVCGAGVSAQIAPDHRHVLLWKDLVVLLARRLQLFINNNDAYNEEQVNAINTPDAPFTSLSQNYSETMKGWGDTRGISLTYHALLHSIFQNVSPAPKQLSHTPESLGEALQALLSPIITTNYDTLLDQCLGRLPINLLGDLKRHADAGQLENFLKIPLNYHHQFVYHTFMVSTTKEKDSLCQRLSTQPKPHLLGDHEASSQVQSFMLSIDGVCWCW